MRLKPSILITAPFEKGHLEELSHWADVTYESWDETFKFWKGEEFRQRLLIDGFDILVTEVDRLTADVLVGQPKLKLICTTRGTPSNVDLAAATRQGIIVTNAPGRNAVSVAELCIALMIGVARHINVGERAIRSGNWDKSLYFSMQGIELTGKTLGLVGLGAVGRELSKRLAGFEMKLLAYDPYISEQDAAKVGCELTDLDSLMSRSDFVSIHLPVTEGTKGLISAEKIALMKSSAYFINTARTVTIDETALLDALSEKRIAGGAFDVYSEEPLSLDSRYLKLDNVLLTPHIAGATKDVITNHSRMAMEDIDSFLAGKVPVRATNPAALSTAESG